MTDDRDDLGSAKDWLAELGKRAETGVEPAEDDAPAADSADAGPGPQPACLPQGMLDRPAELIDLDKVGKPWWRTWYGVGKNFSLVQDGTEIAAISTAMEPVDAIAIEHGTYKKTKRRRTEVALKGTRWTILTQAPIPRRDFKVRGDKSFWDYRNRIVTVKDRDEQIAYFTNPDWITTGRSFGRGREEPEVVTASGESITLKHSYQWGEGHMWTGEALTIKKVKRNYRLTPESPVPLEAALLHWHLILEDWVGEPSGGGGG